MATVTSMQPGYGLVKLANGLVIELRYTGSDPQDSRTASHTACRQGIGIKFPQSRQIGIGVLRDLAR